jgi:hypothetical protein
VSTSIKSFSNDEQIDARMSLRGAQHRQTSMPYSPDFISSIGKWAMDAPDLKDTRVNFPLRRHEQKTVTSCST